MIDIHCHILPNVDDGPRTMDESLEMCRIAVADGIKTIVATPHHNSPYVDSQPAAVVLQRVAELREELRKNEIPLEVLPGQEIHITENILEDIAQCRALTINNAGRFALIEMPNDSVPFFVKEVIVMLKAMGIIAIIAHPERNAQIQSEPLLLTRLIQEGAMTQITAGSLLGQFGLAAQKTATELLEIGFCHVLASDSHRQSHPPSLSTSYAKCSDILGNLHGVNKILNNSLHIVRDKLLSPTKILIKKE